MKKISSLPADDDRRSERHPVAARQRGGGVCRRHRSADPAQEPAGAGADAISSTSRRSTTCATSRKTRDGSVRIGALTKLAEMAESRLLARKYPMLVKAIGMISSPELRNASTIGGDLLQEVWCQYLRGGYSCWRNGGYLCYGAIGDNSYYHSAMGGRLCYAVYPGDAATALIPFDATVTLATPPGLKTLTVEQLVPGDMMVDGRIQSHVVRFERDSHRSRDSAAEAGRAHVVREAPAARRVGFRDGVARVEPQCRAASSPTRASCSAASPAGRCARRRSKACSRARRSAADLADGHSAARARQRRAAQVQRDEDRDGEGPARVRPRQLSAPA